MEGYPRHLPAASGSVTSNSFRNPEMATSHADGDPPATPLCDDIDYSTSFPDIGSSFHKFAAKLLSQSQPALDVVCLIGRDGLMIFDSASADQMLGSYSLQNIARCDVSLLFVLSFVSVLFSLMLCSQVVDSSIFQLWTNNNSSVRLQSDRAGDLLDAVTAEAMLLLGFTNWMYQIKYGSEENDTISSDNVVARDQIPMNQMTPGCSKEMQEIRLYSTWRVPLIPPYNSAATDPKDVYPLGKIIRAGEWRYLRDIIELMERGEEVKCGGYDFHGPYPAYVGSRIKYLWGAKDEAGRAKLGCLLSFITYLMKFNKLHRISGFYRRRSVVVGAANNNIPPLLFRRFSDLFIVPDTGILNSILLNSYVIVLCLFLDDFRSNCASSPLSYMGKRRGIGSSATAIFELLGCKLSMREDRVGIDAELCTPLKLRKESFGGYFREIEMRRRRRRRNDSNNTEQVRKRMKDGLGLNETSQPPQQPGHGLGLNETSQPPWQPGHDGGVT